VRSLSRLRKGVPGTVVALGFVSLFTDFAHEMIYPLIPAFLTDVLGVGALALGVIEGIAESAASILKVVSGWWTDRSAKRKPFVLVGYGIAGAVRPLMAFATTWMFVVLIRFLDRVGKGIRTSPRDALIADVTPPTSRGAAFGLHRSLDHFGAVIGPLAAALLLWLGLTLRQVFFLALVPAIAVIWIITRFVPEPDREPTETARQTPLRRWRDFGPGFWRLIAAVFIFTLGNSADAFLLLRLIDAGVSLIGVAVLWSTFSLVKMGANLVGGRLSDTMGRKRLILAGWVVYALVYLGMALTSAIVPLIGLFFTYGIYFGLTEPVERAWVADLAPADLRGSGFGYYNGAIGIGALPANIVFGGIWRHSDPSRPSSSEPPSLGSQHSFCSGLRSTGKPLLGDSRLRPNALVPESRRRSGGNHG